jgi:hypothetical protein
LQFPRSINNKRLPHLEINVKNMKAEINFNERAIFGSASLGDLYLFDYSSIGKNRRTSICFYFIGYLDLTILKSFLLMHMIFVAFIFRLLVSYHLIKTV